MARAPKKPKFLKYPRKPKKSASLDTFKRYNQRCKEIDKENTAKGHAYNKKIADIKKAHTEYTRISGIGRVTKRPKLATL